MKTEGSYDSEMEIKTSNFEENQD